MRCPKCGYISFDYNQICPKCSKDISLEQEKLNLPSFKPAPPLLLGALIGEESEAQVDMGVDTSSGFEAVSADEVIGREESPIMQDDEIDAADSEHFEIDVDSEDSGDLDLSFDDDDEQEMEEPAGSTEDTLLDLDQLSGDEEDITIEPDDSAAGEQGDALILPDGEEGLDEISLDLEDLGGEEPTQEAASLEEAQSEDDDGLALDLGDAPLDETEDVVEAEGEAAAAGEDDFHIDLDDQSLGQTGEEPVVDHEAEEETAFDLGELSLDDTVGQSATDGGGEADKADEETAISLDTFDLELDAESGGEKDEIELNLDDLTVNATGELEIGALTEDQAKEGDDGLDLEAFSLDDLPSEKEASERGRAEGKHISLDLEDISIVDSDEDELDELENVEGAIDLDDLDLELDLDNPKNNP